MTDQKRLEELRTEIQENLNLINDGLKPLECQNYYDEIRAMALEAVQILEEAATAQFEDEIRRDKKI